MFVRAALPDELGAVGDLRVDAYEAQGLLTANPDYAATLRALGAAGGDVLVAVDGDRVVGTIMLERWGPDSEVARSADEAEVRALAVAPEAQGRGVGAALLRAVMERAASLGVRHLVLSTQPGMTAAHRLYAAHGFARLPDRDWAPVPGLTLLSFGQLLPTVF
ncbi:GNAT family N-acetyltransferase [Amycolatopsis magusensis]|uniref:GNAT family N-acetyltransferase n=1 Tax=Amycolatopsis magusensis TaxID=882444 RepID=UPI0037B2483E